MIKESAELVYWVERLREEGVLDNEHYLYFYTDLFGLNIEDYRGLRLLDVGCGPRGSLEWAGVAAERVGLDPLLDRYRLLGIDRHKMSYVHAPAEAIPFGNAHFDVVTSFNSLDHVDNIDCALQEISRVLKPNGRFLLITEANHAATVTEPVEITDSELRMKLSSSHMIKSWQGFELRQDHDIYRSIREGQPADPASRRPVVIVAQMVKYP
jgi:SAM-dependent methyltransferase